MWRLSRLSCRLSFFLFVGCQRKKCREFYFFAARSIPSIDSFTDSVPHSLTHSSIHSFVHSPLALAWVASVPLLAFRLWPEFYFIPRHRTQTVILPSTPHPNPNPIPSETFGSFIKFSKSHLVLSRSFFPSFLFILLHRNRKGLSDGVAFFFCSLASAFSCHSFKSPHILQYPSVSFRRCALRVGCDKSET